MNRFYLLQMLGTPCVRARKIISMASSEFDVTYLGVKRSIEDVSNDDVIHLGVPIRRGSYGKIFFQFFYFLHAVFVLVKKKPKVVYAADFDAGIPAFLYKLIVRKNVFFVYDVLDTYADRYKVPKIVSNALRWLECSVARCADLVVHVDKIRIQTLPVKLKQVLIVRNLPMLKDLPGSVINRREVAGSEDKIKVLFSGGVFWHRGLSQIVEAIRIIKEKYAQDVALDVIGYGGDSEIEFLKQNSDICNYHGVVTSKEALEFSARSDFLVALYSPDSEINRLACPNKVYDAFYTGIPIILNRELYISAGFEGYKNVVVASYDNPEEIADNLYGAFLRQDEVFLFGMELSERWLKGCSWESEFEAVIREVKGGVCIE
ncbi:glycosyltransferase [Porticoccaceae bacterium LTM1]|nr:glycosyltransferase [Porticoccaceae bacterium LTM1]